jgi:hypothetical protein
MLIRSSAVQVVSKGHHDVFQSFDDGWAEVLVALDD